MGGQKYHRAQRFERCERALPASASAPACARAGAIGGRGQPRSTRGTHSDPIGGIGTDEGEAGRIGTDEGEAGSGQCQVGARSFNRLELFTTTHLFDMVRFPALPWRQKRALRQWQPIHVPKLSLSDTKSSGVCKRSWIRLRKPGLTSNLTHAQTCKRGHPTHTSYDYCLLRGSSGRRADQMERVPITGEDVVSILRCHICPTQTLPLPHTRSQAEVISRSFRKLA